MYRSTDPNATLDVNVHDTYFVISNYDCTLTLFITYFIMGFLYWLFQQLQKQLIKPLTIIHTIILIGSFVIYWLVIPYSKIFLNNPAFPLLKYENQLMNETLTIEFLIIVFIATPIFILNLLIAFIRNIKTL